MDISSELLQLTGPIETAITDFEKHANVNNLIESLRKELTTFVETVVVAIIQPLINSSEFLDKLKAIAAKKALRFHSYRNIYVRLLSGERIPLRSPYFIKAKPKKRGKRKKGNGGGHLALQWLGFIDRISMQLSSVAAQAALLCPSFEIAQQMLKHHGIALGIKPLQRICQLLGRQAMNNRQRIALNNVDRVEGRMVLVCIDGGRIRERKKKRGRRPAGQKRQGYRTDWREPTQIVIQCFNADGSKCKDFLPLYDATMENIDQVFELLEAYLREMQISKAEHVVFCADGDRSYWKRFGPLAEKLQLTGILKLLTTPMPSRTC